MTLATIDHRPSNRPAVVWLLALTLAATAAWAFHAGWIPDRYNPWAALSLDEPPNGLTRLKLARLHGDASQCRQVLAQGGIDVAPVADRETAPGCGWRDAVRLSTLTVPFERPLVVTCEQALALALWERHAVLPLAQRWLGQPVARIVHWGSYACRNVYGRPEGRRSQHAAANALDVAGFVLADGRRVSVARHWGGAGAEARFLAEVRREACRYFGATLGPGYNAAHRDHFHLDRGPWRVCR